MNLTTLISSLLKFTHALSYGTRANPTRDWFVVLGVFLVTLVISIAWSMWYFFSVTSTNIFVSTNTTSVEEIDSSTQVTQFFEERARQVTKYSNEYIFVDPSH